MAQGPRRRGVPGAGCEADVAVPMAPLQGIASAVCGVCGGHVQEGISGLL